MTGITLPADTQQSRLTPRASAPQEDVLDTLREYERLARIACPTYTSVTEFTPDGVTWLPIWIMSEPPAGARSTVTRDSVVVIKNRAWHEALPADDEGREEWAKNPATRMRAFVERAALRDAFADVIVGREQNATPASAAAIAAVATATSATAIGVAKARDAESAASLAHPWDAAPQAVTTEDVWSPRPVAQRPRPQDHLPSNRAGRRAQKRKGRR